MNIRQENHLAISVGQALLILIEHYTQVKNMHFQKKLQKLYLLGVQSPADEELLALAKTHPMLARFSILHDPRVIDADTSRRYFETRLAYELGRDQLAKIQKDHLSQLLNSLYQLIPNADIRSQVESVFNALQPIEIDPYSMEYSEAFNRIRSNPDELFTSEELEKYILLMKIGYMAVKLSNVMGHALPFASPGGLFSTQQRGKFIKDGISKADDADAASPKNFDVVLLTDEILKNPSLKKPYTLYLKPTKNAVVYVTYHQEQQAVIENALLGQLEEFTFPQLLELKPCILAILMKTGHLNQQITTRSLNYGILKSHSPVPYHDKVAQSRVPFNYLRPADAGAYIPYSMWAKKNFSQLVHPYSNSISGTLLCQLKVMKHLHNCGERIVFFDTDHFIAYAKCFTSLLAYNGGGHSYSEFTAVFEHEAIKEGMAFISGFHQINGARLWWDNNEPVLHKVFSATILYNKALITKQDANALIAQPESKRYIKPN